LFQRQKQGSVLCPSCGVLVGVNDPQCLTCGRRNPGMFGFAAAIRALGRDLGFMQLVLSGSIVLFGLTLLADPAGIDMGSILTFMSPSQHAVLDFGASGQYPVFSLGRWWTVLSAGWLHGGILHLLFNMNAVRVFAPATAEFYGAGRMVLIYIVSSVVGFLWSSVVFESILWNPLAGLFGILGLNGGQLTLGASAAICGLLGALLYYGRRTGSRAIREQVVGYAVSIAVMGLLLRGIVDNQAHIGGFVGGYLTARFLDPLEPERGDHLFLAVVGLVLTAVAIVVSILTAPENYF
jgi:rhomboid protease GluP